MQRTYILNEGYAQRIRIQAKDLNDAIKKTFLIKGLSLREVEE